MNDELPQCKCGKPLDRIDHYAIEHTILDDDVYRMVNVGDPPAPDWPGAGSIASETDLRCGYCGESIPQEARAYFYKRWWQMVMLTRDDLEDESMWGPGPGSGLWR